MVYYTCFFQKMQPFAAFFLNRRCYDGQTSPAFPREKNGIYVKSVNFFAVLLLYFLLLRIILFIIWGRLEAIAQ
jgi:hypothetical protein